MRGVSERSAYGRGEGGGRSAVEGGCGVRCPLSGRGGVHHRDGSTVPATVAVNVEWSPRPEGATSARSALRATDRDPPLPRRAVRPRGIPRCGPERSAAGARRRFRGRVASCAAPSVWASASRTDAARGRRPERRGGGCGVRCPL